MSSAISISGKKKSLVGFLNYTNSTIALSSNGTFKFCNEKKQEDNPGWNILLLIVSWTSKNMLDFNSCSFWMLRLWCQSCKCRILEKESCVNGSHVLFFWSDGANTVQANQKGKWIRGVQTQDRQPVEKPFSFCVPVDLNSSLFLETAGCSQPSSAPAAHWSCSHRFGLFIWKQDAMKTIVLLWAHSMAAQPEEQDEARMCIQRPACPVHLAMC